MKTLIICPIREEYEATKALLTSIRYHRGKHTNRQYLSGRYGNRRVLLLRSGRGETAVGNAVHVAIRDFNLSYLFLVGTAGGIQKVKIGDIVVASAGYQYESGRELGDVFHSIPQTLNSNEELLQLAIEQSDEIFSATPELMRKDVCIFFKPIASGAKIIESKEGQSFKILQERYNDAIALEMEAYAFQAAVKNHASVQALNIRGISDLLSDKRKANAKGSKALATRHAALFTLSLIQRLAFPTVLWKRLLLTSTAAIALIFSFLLWSNFLGQREPQEEALKTPIETFDTTALQQENPIVLTTPSPEPSKQQTQKPIASNEDLPIEKQTIEHIEIEQAPIDTSAILTIDTNLIVNTSLEGEKDKTEVTDSEEEPIEVTKESPITMRCYVAVTDKGKKISNVSVFIDEEEVQTANNHLQLSVGWHWMLLEKDGMYYRKRIQVREDAIIKQTFHVRWNEFSIKQYHSPNTVEANADLGEGHK